MLDKADIKYPDNGYATILHTMGSFSYASMIHWPYIVWRYLHNGTLHKG